MYSYFEMDQHESADVIWETPLFLFSWHIGFRDWENCKTCYPCPFQWCRRPCYIPPCQPNCVGAVCKEPRTWPVRQRPQLDPCTQPPRSMERIFFIHQNHMEGWIMSALAQTIRMRISEHESHTWLRSTILRITRLVTIDRPYRAGERDSVSERALCPCRHLTRFFLKFVERWHFIVMGERNVAWPRCMIQARCTTQNCNWTRL